MEDNQPQYQNFDAQTVSQQYKILSSGRTKDERQKANRYILEFMQSDQAWIIAQNLLQQQTTDIQFIGAQALLQKLKFSFDTSSLKDDQIKELINTLFQMLKDMSTSENKSRVVFERLCMCISYMAIKTVNGAWTDSIANVISFGSVNSSQCFISLLILKHIALTYDQHVFDKRTSTMIENYLRENLAATLDYINTIIITKDLPEECYHESFSTAKQWCAYSTKTFIPHEQFITNIFALLQNPQVAPKIINIIKKLLIKSKHVKLLENVSYDLAFSSIPKIDMQFLEMVIQWLQNNRDKLIAVGQADPSDEDTIKLASKYTELLVLLCSNYEIMLIRVFKDDNYNVCIFIQDSEVSKLLFQLLIDCAASKNLRISQLSLHFWDEFKETINTHLDSEQLQEHLFKPYVDICRILLVQCRKTEGGENKPEGDLEELEQYERGMSVAKYREYACDVYFKAFFLLRKIYKQQGSKLIFDMILEAVQNFGIPNEMESGLYAAKSIIDAFENNQEYVQFVGQIFQAIIQSNQISRNIIVAKGSVLFIHEASVFLKFLNSQISQITELLVTTSMTFPQLQDIVIKTIFEMCQQCKQNFGDQEFTMLYQYLASSYKTLNNNQVGMLMEAVCTICSILDAEKLPLAVAQTSQIAVQLLQNIDIQQIHNIDRDDLQKALLMLSGCVKAIDTLPAAVVKSAIFPIIQNIWSNLCTILEVKYNDVEVAVLICDLFQKLVKALNIEMAPLFGSMTKALLTAFEAKSDNIKCLRVFSFSCSILGRQPDVLLIITSTYDQLCQVIVNKVFKAPRRGDDDNLLSIENINVDIVKCLAELMHKVAELDINILMNSPYFHDMIGLFHETLVKVNSKETNNELVFFFSYLIQCRNGLPIVIKYLDIIAGSLICAVSKELGGLLDKISNALVVLMNTAEAQNFETSLRHALEKVLQIDTFKNLSPKTKALFINILFAFKSQRQKVKLTLVNFNGLVNGVMGEDCLLGLELEATNMIKIQQAQQESYNNGMTQVIQLD